MYADYDEEHRECKARNRGKVSIDGEIAGRKEWEGVCIGKLE
jgi:hypothetical protein